MLPSIRVAVRSGDTPARERQLMVRRPPHIPITTPESLYILLTASRSREFLRSTETVILDEIHAVAQDKRGAHLALSIERLQALAARPLQRIGLSATQKPIEDIARLLVGSHRIGVDGAPACTIIDAGHQREMDLRIEVPDEELGPIIRQDIWSAVYDRLAEQIRAHKATLVFVNTRRLVERVAHQLTERLGEGKVGAHHGSLSRKTRLEVEEKLKTGALPGGRGHGIFGVGHRHRPRRCGLSYRLAAQFGGAVAARRPLGSLARRDSQGHFLPLDA